MKSRQVIPLFFVLFAGLLLTSTADVCDPSNDRHCEPFPEKNVESVAVVATEVVQEPVEPDDELPPPPPSDAVATPATPASTPVLTTRSGDGDNSFGATGIVATSVGAAVLVLVVAAVRRRRAAAASAALDSGLSNLSSVGPSEGV